MWPFSIGNRKQEDAPFAGGRRIGSLTKAQEAPLSPALGTAGTRSRNTLPVLVMIQSDGSPVLDDAFLEHILNLPEVRQQVGPASQCRVRTFGSPKGFREQLDARLGPSDPKDQRVMDTIAMLLVHAPEYKDVTDFWWCTITDPATGRKYRVTVCKP